MPARATGANVFLRGAFQSDYEIAAASGYLNLSFYSGGVSAGQEFLNDILLGSGRDPDPPQLGAIDVDGQLEVPVDHRRSGFWLKSYFGATQSDSQIGARGYIDFKAQPAADSTITLNGVAWTFKASGATGNQTDIGVSLEATLDALVSGLNGSADTDIDDATYTRLGDRLVIEHDTASTAGNSYTLAASTASNGTVSAATLTGGGFYKHLWHSAAAVLPDYTLETYHSDWDPGSDRYFVEIGCRTKSLAISRERTGAAKITVDIIGHNEVAQAATGAGTPTDLTVAVFSQFNGVLLGDERRIANLVNGNLTVGNNLDVVDGLRDDGLIDAADPGPVSIAIDFTARFSENALQVAAKAGVPMEIRFGYYDKITGAEMMFQFHEVYLNKPRRQIQGPGGIEQNYSLVGARDSSLSRSMTAWLINDVASY